MNLPTWIGLLPCTALAVIMATSVAVLGQLYKVERRIRSNEPGAALVIAIVLGSPGLICNMR